MSELDRDIKKLISLIDSKFSTKGGCSAELAELRGLLKVQLFTAQSLCISLSDRDLKSRIDLTMAAPGVNVGLLEATWEPVAALAT